MYSYHTKAKRRVLSAAISNEKHHIRQSPNLTDNRPPVQPQIMHQSGLPIQLAEAKSTEFPKVTGDSNLIRLFDQLMKSPLFAHDVNEFLRPVSMEGLRLEKDDGSSRYHRGKHVDTIYIRRNLRGEKTKEQLGFELHNAISSNSKITAKTVIDNGLDNDNVKDIKTCRLMEFIEWLNLIRYTVKYEQDGKKMGFRHQPSLLEDIERQWHTFDTYLVEQIKNGHTQRYVRHHTLHSERFQGQEIDTDSRDVAYYRTELPTLFIPLSQEAQLYQDLMDKIDHNSGVKRKLIWGQNTQGEQKHLLKKAGNLRKDNLSKTVISKILVGTVVIIKNKNKSGNHFSTGITNSKPHYWVEVPGGLQGWLNSECFA
ncbi:MULTISPECIES: hypothetical protein [Pseudoalteromonas]|uniref:Uncharacterized protein n=1 Tax=Pseudoalteromonas amylolytica TaxID=1859457 RepID=A0A1S1N0B0_9GAMM|nr:MULTISPECIES: hypothetical protein [Pseudoalteromonas]OHU90590.1 hypothetical protein BFC16_03010 [Pseudoalteromonas sp. JW3]OHU92789.1 hypothetical protein BET10_04885 [Pseudoalteromonas amylolytica]